MSKFNRGFFATIMVCSAFLPLSVSAAVSDDAEDTAVKVSYADLNIHNEAGAKVLYYRLQHASRAVCGVRSFIEQGSVEAVTEARKCYNDALDSAIAKIDSEALANIHSST